MYKNYLISFDPNKTDSSALHNVIKSSEYINGWWHWIGPAYIVRSTYTLATVHQDIHSRWPGNRFLIIEVDLKSHNGWLPTSAWKWINDHKNK